MVLMVLSAMILNAADMIKTEAETLPGYRSVTILDKGVKRKRYVSEKSRGMSTRSAVSQKGLIVSFKKGTDIDIDHFASTYGLKLKVKLPTGYYVFENISGEDDGVIGERIIRNEKSKVSTVKPNWKKSNGLR